MKLLDLFSGIGGFSLAAHWAGWQTVAFVEIEKYCQKVLEKNFPNVQIYGDIKEFESTKYKGCVDIITGGFPCQDISIANSKAKGIKGSRSGLWAEMFRIIRSVRPRFVVIENSAAITFRGLERVLCDLSEIGYDAEWQNISGKKIGVQQLRERLYIVAYPNEIRQERKPKEQMVFTQSPKQFMRVAPGWRTRRHLPSPKLIRSAYDVPNSLHRVAALGNSVIPLIPYYIFERINYLTSE